MIEEAVAELGKEEFNNLSDEKKHLFQLFIWVGCGCHKNLSTIWGGYLAMAAWWIKNELEEECPVLLDSHDYESSEFTKSNLFITPDLEHFFSVETLKLAFLP